MDGMDGGSDRLKRPEEMSINKYVLALTYTLKGMTGLGFMALTWATMILLGGSAATSMGNKDFWCVRVICMIQAARIFNDFAEEQFANFILQVMYQVLKGAALTVAANYSASERHGKNSILYFLAIATSVLPGLTIILPCTVILGMPLLVAALIYDLGPLACIGVSCWRIVKHDYIDKEGNANLVPALHLFYSLVLCQGVFYCIWKLGSTDCIKNWQVAPLHQQCKFTEEEKSWGSSSIAAYFSDTKRQCWKDPGSIDGRTMIHYAIDLLGTESWQENLFGARMLDVFIRQGADLRSLLLPSRHKIQKLIDMLGWRRGPPEIREVAARIVVAVAGDIHLAQFPGAICCISSLLQDETTLIHEHKSKHPHCKGPNQNQNRCVKAYMNILDLFEGRLAKLRQQIGRLPKQEESDGSTQYDNGCTAEMILQGLTILERLASNHPNCSYICTARGLLQKITSPLYSDTLIQDMDISGTWFDFLNRSFKVLHCLICSPGWTGRSLGYEISRNNQAMANLEMILQLRKEKNQKMVLEQANRVAQELRIQATKILTELMLDLSVKLRDGIKENFIKKQLHIFFPGEGEQELASVLNLLKVTAGRTLTLLLISTNSQAYSNFIMKAYDNDPLTGSPDNKNTSVHPSQATQGKKNNADHLTNEITEDKTPVGHLKEETEDKKNIAHLTERDKKNTFAFLTKMLDATNNITYRTIAAEILENICTHCDWDKHKQIIKELLLPKVITEILSIKSDQPEGKISDEKENKPLSRTWTHSRKKNNQGNQKSFVPPGKDEESQKIIAPGDKSMIQEFSSSGDQKKSSDEQNKEQTANKELQEALLSLALVICDKLISVDAVIQDKALEGETFVVKLKTIIEENCQPRADSLRIVKLCGRIAASMMQCQPYAERFRNKKFAQSLTKASGIMSNLESCMIFSGTDFGLKKTVRPLLSELEKKVSDLEKKEVQLVRR